MLSNLSEYLNKIHIQEKESQKRNQSLLSEISDVSKNADILDGKTYKLREIRRDYQSYLQRVYPTWESNPPHKQKLNSVKKDRGNNEMQNKTRHSVTFERDNIKNNKSLYDAFMAKKVDIWKRDKQQRTSFKRDENKRIETLHMIHLLEESLKDSNKSYDDDEFLSTSTPDKFEMFLKKRTKATQLSNNTSSSSCDSKPFLPVKQERPYLNTTLPSPQAYHFTNNQEPPYPNATLPSPQVHRSPHSQVSPQQPTVQIIPQLLGLDSYGKLILLPMTPPYNMNDPAVNTQLPSFQPVSQGCYSNTTIPSQHCPIDPHKLSNEVPKGYRQSPLGEPRNTPDFPHIPSSISKQFPQDSSNTFVPAFNVAATDVIPLSPARGNVPLISSREKIPLALTSDGFRDDIPLTSTKDNMSYTSKKKVISFTSPVASRMEKNPIASTQDDIELTSPREKIPLASTRDDAKLTSSRENIPLASTRDDTKLISSKENTPLASTRDHTILTSSREITPLTSTRDHTKFISSKENTPLASTRDDSKFISSKENTPLASTRDDSEFISSKENTPLASTRDHTKIEEKQDILDNGLFNNSPLVKELDSSLSIAKELSKKSTVTKPMDEDLNDSLKEVDLKSNDLSCSNNSSLFNFSDGGSEFNLLSNQNVSVVDKLSIDDLNSDQTQKPPTKKIDDDIERSTDFDKRLESESLIKKVNENIADDSQPLRSVTLKDNIDVGVLFYLLEKLSEVIEDKHVESLVLNLEHDEPLSYTVIGICAMEGDLSNYTPSQLHMTFRRALHIFVHQTHERFLLVDIDAGINFEGDLRDAINPFYLDLWDTFYSFLSNVMGIFDFLPAQVAAIYSALFLPDDVLTGKLQHVLTNVLEGLSNVEFSLNDDISIPIESDEKDHDFDRHNDFMSATHSDGEVTEDLSDTPYVTSKQELSELEKPSDDTAPLNEQSKVSHGLNPLENIQNVVLNNSEEDHVSMTEEFSYKKSQSHSEEINNDNVRRVASSEDNLSKSLEFNSLDHYDSDSSTVSFDSEGMPVKRNADSAEKERTVAHVETDATEGEGSRTLNTSSSAYQKFYRESLMSPVHEDSDMEDELGESMKTSSLALKKKRDDLARSQTLTSPLSNRSNAGNSSTNVKMLKKPGFWDHSESDSDIDLAASNANVVSNGNEDDDFDFDFYD